MQRHDRTKGSRPGGCHPRKQGSPVRERCAREMRHNEVVTLQHVESDSEIGRVVGLPRIVTEEAERYPCDAKQKQARMLVRTVGP